MEFFSDPSEFLAVAAERLAADPVVSTVVTTVADREVRRRASGEGPAYPHAPHWYAAARDDSGRVTGIAMRTATSAPYPLFVLEMSTDDARALARRCFERGEIAPANGALPAAREFCDELARLAGGRVEVREHTRLFELSELVPPARLPDGQLQVATAEHAELCLEWFNRFHREAAEQAGHSKTHSAVDEFTIDDMLRRIDEGRVWLWFDSGEPVHLTGANPPAFGVSRIGPVFTPKEHRGRGYASAAVAEVSRQILESGARACLFTDQANPTSNRIYEALGYRPVVDMANHDLL